MGVSVDLIAKAKQAFESEARCWVRQGTWTLGRTMLIRDPWKAVWAFGTSEIQKNVGIEQIAMPDAQVDSYLLDRCLERALQAIQDEITQAAVGVVNTAEAIA